MLFYVLLCFIHLVHIGNNLEIENLSRLSEAELESTWKDSEDVNLDTDLKDLDVIEELNSDVNVVDFGKIGRDVTANDFVKLNRTTDKYAYTDIANRTVALDDGRPKKLQRKTQKFTTQAPVFKQTFIKTNVTKKSKKNMFRLFKKNKTNQVLVKSTIPYDKYEFSEYENVSPSSLTSNKHASYVNFENLNRYERQNDRSTPEENVKIVKDEDPVSVLLLKYVNNKKGQSDSSYDGPTFTKRLKKDSKSNSKRAKVYETYVEGNANKEALNDVDIQGKPDTVAGKDSKNNIKSNYSQMHVNLKNPSNLTSLDDIEIELRKKNKSYDPKFLSNYSGLYYHTSINYLDTMTPATMVTTELHENEVSLLDDYTGMEQRLKRNEKVQKTGKIKNFLNKIKTKIHKTKKSKNKQKRLDGISRGEVVNRRHSSSDHNYVRKRDIKGNSEIDRMLKTLHSINRTSNASRKHNKQSKMSESMNEMEEYIKASKQEYTNFEKQFGIKGIDVNKIIANATLNQRLKKDISSTEVESFFPKKKAENPINEKDDILSSDYVNGYKYFKDYMNKEREDSKKFSAQIRYQAHRHHSVDSIGKPILEKLPPMPGEEDKREKRKVSRKFLRLNDFFQEITTTPSRIELERLWLAHGLTTPPPLPAGSVTSLMSSMTTAEVAKPKADAASSSSPAAGSAAAAAGIVIIPVTFADSNLNVEEETKRLANLKAKDITATSAGSKESVNNEKLVNEERSFESQLTYADSFEGSTTQVSKVIEFDEYNSDSNLFRSKRLAYSTEPNLNSWHVVPKRTTKKGNTKKHKALNNNKSKIDSSKKKDKIAQYSQRNSSIVQKSAFQTLEKKEQNEKCNDPETRHPIDMNQGSISSDHLKYLLSLDNSKVLDDITDSYTSVTSSKFDTQLREVSPSSQNEFSIDSLHLASKDKEQPFDQLASVSPTKSSVSVVYNLNKVSWASDLARMYKILEEVGEMLDFQQSMTKYSESKTSNYAEVNPSLYSTINLDDLEEMTNKPYSYSSTFRPSTNTYIDLSTVSRRDEEPLQSSTADQSSPAYYDMADGSKQNSKMREDSDFAYQDDEKGFESNDFSIADKPVSLTTNKATFMSNENGHTIRIGLSSNKDLSLGSKVNQERQGQHMDKRQSQYKYEMGDNEGLFFGNFNDFDTAAFVETNGFGSGRGIFMKPKKNTDKHTEKIHKVITHPDQHFEVPLPMETFDFDKFLKNYSLDVDTVTMPIYRKSLESQSTSNHRREDKYKRYYGNSLHTIKLKNHDPLTYIDDAYMAKSKLQNLKEKKTNISEKLFHNEQRKIHKELKQLRKIDEETKNDNFNPKHIHSLTNHKAKPNYNDFTLLAETVPTIGYKIAFENDQRKRNDRELNTEFLSETEPFDERLTIDASGDNTFSVSSDNVDYFSKPNKLLRKKKYLSFFPFFKPKAKVLEINPTAPTNMSNGFTDVSISIDPETSSATTKSLTTPKNFNRSQSSTISNKENKTVDIPGMLISNFQLVSGNNLKEDTLSTSSKTTTKEEDTSKRNEVDDNFFTDFYFDMPKSKYLSSDLYKLSTSSDDYEWELFVSTEHDDANDDTGLFEDLPNSQASNVQPYQYTTESAVYKLLLFNLSAISMIPNKKQNGDQANEINRISERRIFPHFKKKKTESDVAITEKFDMKPDIKLPQKESAPQYMNVSETTLKSDKNNLIDPKNKQNIKTDEHVSVKNLNKETPKQNTQNSLEEGASTKANTSAIKQFNMNENIQKQSSSTPIFNNYSKYVPSEQRYYTDEYDSMAEVTLINNVNISTEITTDKELMENVEDPSKYIFNLEVSPATTEPNTESSTVTKDNRLTQTSPAPSESDESFDIHSELSEISSSLKPMQSEFSITESLRAKSFELPSKSELNASIGLLNSLLSDMIKERKYTEDAMQYINGMQKSNLSKNLDNDRENVDSNVDLREIKNNFFHSGKLEPSLRIEKESVLFQVAFNDLDTVTTKATHAHQGARPTTTIATLLLDRNTAEFDEDYDSTGAFTTTPQGPHKDKKRQPVLNRAGALETWADEDILDSMDLQMAVNNIEDTLEESERNLLKKSSSENDKNYIDQLLNQLSTIDTTLVDQDNAFDGAYTPIGTENVMEYTYAESTGEHYQGLRHVKLPPQSNIPEKLEFDNSIYDFVDRQLDMAQSDLAVVQWEDKGKTEATTEQPMADSDEEPFIERPYIRKRRSGNDSDDEEDEDDIEDKPAKEHKKKKIKRKKKKTNKNNKSDKSEEKSKKTSKFFSCKKDKKHKKNKKRRQNGDDDLRLAKNVAAFDIYLDSKNGIINKRSDNTNRNTLQVHIALPQHLNLTYKKQKVFGGYFNRPVDVQYVTRVVTPFETNNYYNEKLTDVLTSSGVTDSSGASVDHNMEIKNLINDLTKAFNLNNENQTQDKISELQSTGRDEEMIFLIKNLSTMVDKLKPLKVALDETLKRKSQKRSKDDYKDPSNEINDIYLPVLLSNLTLLIQNGSVTPTLQSKQSMKRSETPQSKDLLDALRHSMSRVKPKYQSLRGKFRQEYQKPDKRSKEFSEKPKDNEDILNLLKNLTGCLEQDANQQLYLSVADKVKVLRHLIRAKPPKKKTDSFNSDLGTNSPNLLSTTAVSGGHNNKRMTSGEHQNVTESTQRKHKGLGFFYKLGEKIKNNSESKKHSSPVTEISSVKSSSETGDPTAKDEIKNTSPTDSVSSVYNEQSHNKEETQTKSTRRKRSLKAVGKIMGNVTNKIVGNSVCPCSCVENKTMCKTCAKIEKVVEELSFEFENLSKFIDEHCMQLQTFFYLNPTKGAQLREMAHHIDKIMNLYAKRSKGKCKQTCDNNSTLGILTLMNLQNLVEKPLERNKFECGATVNKSLLIDKIQEISDKLSNLTEVLETENLPFDKVFEENYRKFSNSLTKLLISRRKREIFETQQNQNPETENSAVEVEIVKTVTTIHPIDQPIQTIHPINPKEEIGRKTAFKRGISNNKIYQNRFESQNNLGQSENNTKNRISMQHILERHLSKRSSHNKTKKVDVKKMRKQDMDLSKKKTHDPVEKLMLRFRSFLLGGNIDVLNATSKKQDAKHTKTTKASFLNESPLIETIAAGSTCIISIPESEASNENTDNYKSIISIVPSDNFSATENQMDMYIIMNSTDNINNLGTVPDALNPSSANAKRNNQRTLRNVTDSSTNFTKVTVSNASMLNSDNQTEKSMYFIQDKIADVINDLNSIEKLKVGNVYSAFSNEELSRAIANISNDAIGENLDKLASLLKAKQLATFSNKEKTEKTNKHELAASKSHSYFATSNEQELLHDLMQYQKYLQKAYSKVNPKRNHDSSLTDTTRYDFGWTRNMSSVSGNIELYLDRNVADSNGLLKEETSLNGLEDSDLDDENLKLLQTPKKSAQTGPIRKSDLPLSNVFHIHCVLCDAAHTKRKQNNKNDKERQGKHNNQNKRDTKLITGKPLLITDSFLVGKIQEYVKNLLIKEKTKTQIDKTPTLAQDVESKILDWKKYDVFTSTTAETAPMSLNQTILYSFTVASSSTANNSHVEDEGQGYFEDFESSDYYEDVEEPVAEISTPTEPETTAFHTVNYSEVATPVTEETLPEDLIEAYLDVENDESSTTAIQNRTSDEVFWATVSWLERSFQDNTATNASTMSGEVSASTMPAEAIAAQTETTFITSNFEKLISTATESHSDKVDSEKKVDDLYSETISNLTLKNDNFENITKPTESTTTAVLSDLSDLTRVTEYTHQEKTTLNPNFSNVTAFKSSLTTTKKMERLGSKVTTLNDGIVSITASSIDDGGQNKIEKNLAGTASAAESFHKIVTDNDEFSDHYSRENQLVTKGLVSKLSNASKNFVIALLSENNTHGNPNEMKQDKSSKTPIDYKTMYSSSPLPVVEKSKATGQCTIEKLKCASCKLWNITKSIYTHKKKPCNASTTPMPKKASRTTLSAKDENKFPVSLEVTITDDSKQKNIGSMVDDNSRGNDWSDIQETLDRPNEDDAEENEDLIKETTQVFIEVSQNQATEIETPLGYNSRISIRDGTSDSESARTFVYSNELTNQKLDDNTLKREFQILTEKNGGTLKDSSNKPKELQETGSCDPAILGKKCLCNVKHSVESLNKMKRSVPLAQFKENIKDFKCAEYGFSPDKLILTESNKDSKERRDVYDDYNLENINDKNLEQAVTQTQKTITSTIDWNWIRAKRFINIDDTANIINLSSPQHTNASVSEIQQAKEFSTQEDNGRIDYIDNQNSYPVIQENKDDELTTIENDVFTEKTEIFDSDKYNKLPYNMENINQDLLKNEEVLVSQQNDTKNTFRPNLFGKNMITYRHNEILKQNVNDNTKMEGSEKQSDTKFTPSPNQRDFSINELFDEIKAMIESYSNNKGESKILTSNKNISSKDHLFDDYSLMDSHEQYYNDDNVGLSSKTTSSLKTLSPINKINNTTTASNCKRISFNETMPLNEKPLSYKTTSTHEASPFYETNQQSISIKIKVPFINFKNKTTSKDINSLYDSKNNEHTQRTKNASTESTIYIEVGSLKENAPNKNIDQKAFTPIHSSTNKVLTSYSMTPIQDSLSKNTAGKISDSIDYTSKINYGIDSVVLVQESTTNSDILSSQSSEVHDTTTTTTLATTSISNDNDDNSKVVYIQDSTTKAQEISYSIEKYPLLTMIESTSSKINTKVKSDIKGKSTKAIQTFANTLASQSTKLTTFKRSSAKVNTNKDSVKYMGAFKDLLTNVFSFKGKARGSKENKKASKTTLQAQNERTSEKALFKDNFDEIDEIKIADDDQNFRRARAIRENSIGTNFHKILQRRHSKEDHKKNIDSDYDAMSELKDLVDEKGKIHAFEGDVIILKSAAHNGEWVGNRKSLMECTNLYTGESNLLIKNASLYNAGTYKYILDDKVLDVRHIVIVKIPEFSYVFASDYVTENGCTSNDLSAFDEGFEAKLKEHLDKEVCDVVVTEVACFGNSKASGLRVTGLLKVSPPKSLACSVNCRRNVAAKISALCAAALSSLLHVDVVIQGESSNRTLPVPAEDFPSKVHVRESIRRAGDEVIRKMAKKIQPRNLSLVTPCVAGFYLHRASKICVMCGMNEYSSAGANRCRRCPPGQRTRRPGSAECVFRARQMTGKKYDRLSLMYTRYWGGASVLCGLVLGACLCACLVTSVRHGSHTAACEVGEASEACAHSGPLPAPAVRAALYGAARGRAPSPSRVLLARRATLRACAACQYRRAGTNDVSSCQDISTYDGRTSASYRYCQNSNFTIYE